uniref:Large ribosomal subunit protein uL15/eL18 domain-containing protein n=1 Tax=Polytomella parva TaxID=51329 RepID=A0A7S0VE23_9CHLO
MKQLNKMSLQKIFSSLRGSLVKLESASQAWTSMSALQNNAGGLFSPTRFHTTESKHFEAPNYFVHLGNLRPNPNSTKQRIRVGRGLSSRRGVSCGMGFKGQKARGRSLHMLFDGGQLGLVKFPVTRQVPSYEVLYNQIGLTSIVECCQLGLLDHTKLITMKDLLDAGCVRDVKYGVLLYGKSNISFPINIQVTACDDDSRQSIKAAGGTVTRVYYTKDNLEGLLNPKRYTDKNLPLPLPAIAWHPKFDGKFDAIGQIPPLPL